MILLDCKQGSPEWLEARLAIPTSSCFSKILKASGTISTQWFGYMDKLLAEYIDADYKSKRFKSKAMENGNILEPAARKQYEIIKKCKVIEVGGIFFDDRKEMMCSPDGLIPELKKGYEVKCPDLDTHLGYLRKNELPYVYKLQVQTGLAFSDFETWDFMSYHPKYKPLIITVNRDELLIKNIKEAALFFSEQLKARKAEVDEYLNVGF